jgi:hypothetical protein
VHVHALPQTRRYRAEEAEARTRSENPVGAGIGDIPVTISVTHWSKGNVDAPAALAPGDGG